ncbi:hypothetical protein [Thiocapsa roseopersicina]|nr:hypothetical protein [Thiocapsa roseopersicina]
MVGLTAATIGLALYTDRVGKAHGSPGRQADARYAWLDAGANAA